MPDTFAPLLISSLFLIFLLIGSRYLIRRLNGQSYGGIIKIISKMMLSPDRSIYVVDINGVQYILVSDRGGTTLIDKRTDLELLSAQNLPSDNSVFNNYINLFKEKKDE